MAKAYGRTPKSHGELVNLTSSEAALVAPLANSAHARWGGICCNRDPFRGNTMGVAYYLALVGAGLVAAYLLTVVLKGIRLI